MPLATGTRLGSYEILAALGAGGMGEVYRAHDTKLNRDVAIKVLPDLFANDPGRLARFQREAQVLASLNHPNIAHIHGLEESNGTRALVMELVEGPTLADRIANGPIPLPEALPIAKQIAEALEAAHEQGVIHRDLKPANIKVRTDGTVKVLDFGLAKAIDPEGPRSASASQSPTITTPAMTQAGMILGTAAYMSPEQARGQEVDKRTDIWAFGGVLYEMLTGHAAFGRDTMSDTLAAILDHDPDWTLLAATTPPALGRLLKRCLDKDVKRRLRDIGDVGIELRDLLASQQSAEVRQPIAVSTTPLRLRTWLGLAATVILLTLGAAYLIHRLGSGEAPARGEAKIEQFTRDSGLTTMPTLSPDARLIAYASDRAGRGDLDIWVQQVTGGTPLQLTTDMADDQMPEFSPDGSQIAFRSERGNGGVYVVPALGGEARLVAEGGEWPRFSPDGRKIAYWVGQWRGNPSALATASYVLDLNGGSPTQVLSGFAVARDPRWAPDGQSLLVLGRRALDAPLEESFDWWWVPLDGRPAVKTGLLDLMDLRRETDKEVVTAGPWTDEGFMLGIRGSLWSVPVSWTTGRSNGTPRQLTFGAGGVYRFPAVSKDGRLIVFNVSSLTRTIERVSLVDPTAVPAILYSESGSGASRPSQTLDGSTVLFQRNSSQFTEAWVRDMRTGQQRSILRLDAASGLSPTLSPDATRVAYTVERQPDIGTGFVVDVAGGVPRKVCEACGLHGFVSDNQHILIVTKSRHEIGILDVTGGPVQPIVDSPEGLVDRPHSSPDGRWLAVRRVIAETAKVLVGPLQPGRLLPLDQWARVNEPTTTPRPAGWSPDSRVLYLLLDTDGFRCLWGQRVDPLSGRLIGKPYPVRHFHSTIQEQFSNSFGNAFTADTFLYGGSRESGNIWRLSLSGER